MSGDVGYFNNANATLYLNSIFALLEGREVYLLKK